MVSFDDRPTIHLIPFYRPSSYENLFWHPDDFAEFKREAYMEKDEELLAENDDTSTPTTIELPVPKPIPVHVPGSGPLPGGNQRLVPVVVDKEEQFPVCHRRGYDRPDDSLPLQPRRAKIGYAIKIRAIREVTPS